MKGFGILSNTLFMLFHAFNRTCVISFNTKKKKSSYLQFVPKKVFLDPVIYFFI